ncbi:HNH endonuclease [Ureibacillus chungkukjangi]|uniref:HNH endonuclease n=1 Tax=Ureibacillus chungkukjangi TaxID=1202712 RepID=UPI00204244CC|nr:HNH endonuclease [Ureibacillus chungkukjangi]
MVKYNVDTIKLYLARIGEGYYTVKDFRLHRNDKPLGTVGKNGYLSHSVIGGSIYAHRLMFAYYYGLDELLKYESINHIDGNKLNNNPSNLEGMSLAENSKHQWEIGLANRGSDCSYTVLSDQEVKQIKKMLKLKYSQAVIAKHFKVHRSTILSINLGHNWAHIILDMSVEIPNIPKNIERETGRFFTDDDIAFIRNSIVNGTHTRKELAEIYNISYSVIRKYTKFLRPYNTKEE